MSDSNCVAAANGGLFQEHRRSLTSGINLVPSGVGATLIKVCAPDLLKNLKQRPYVQVAGGTLMALVLYHKKIVDSIPQVTNYMLSTGMASISIAEHDEELHGAMKAWLLTNAAFQSRKSLIATSSVTARNSRAYKLPEDTPVLYEGESALQFFRHNGRYFIYSEEGGKQIKIFCLGFSTDPIKRLLEEVHTAAQLREGIAVYNAGSSNWAVDNPGWVERSRAYPRTLASVCLDQEIKSHLVDDITTYLAPDSEKFYAERGIPFRRGYLLHGKPGCGKTSFAMAVAGQFNLSVYTVSLLDNKLTDGRLIQLFQSLQKGMLLLLEDIDCAGLGREVKEDSQKTEDEDDDTDGEDDETIETQEDAGWGRGKKPTSTSRKQKHKAPEKKKDPPSRVTLSGLLNAIDGASAPASGHVLIMTTNHPELLDTALIRPGRADVHIEFEYATREQARDLFSRMYEHYNPAVAAKYNIDDIPVLANEFARLYTPRSLSPAQIQQYLFQYRVRPRQAVARAAAWFRTVLGEQYETVSDTNFSVAETDLDDISSSLSPHWLSNTAGSEQTLGHKLDAVTTSSEIAFPQTSTTSASSQDEQQVDLAMPGNDGEDDTDSLEEYLEEFVNPTWFGFPAESAEDVEIKALRREHARLKLANSRLEDRLAEAIFPGEEYPSIGEMWTDLRGWFM